MQRFLLVSVLSACWRSHAPPPEEPPPACDRILAHLRELTLDIVTADDRDPTSRDEIAKTVDPYMPKPDECAQWPAQYKRCLVHASTERGWYQCERDKQIALGTDMSGPACERVVTHVLGILVSPSLADDAAFVKRMHGIIDNGCLVMTRKHKECVLGAKDQDAFIACNVPAKHSL